MITLTVLFSVLGLIYIYGFYKFFVFHTKNGIPIFQRSFKESREYAEKVKANPDTLGINQLFKRIHLCTFIIFALIILSVVLKLP